MQRWWNNLENDQRWLVRSVAAMWIAQVLYFLSPIDLLPDLIPLIGWLDDLFALLATVSFTIFAAWRLRSTGFADLMPAALRPASLREAPEPEPELADEIPGYHPLSADELRSL